jgi:hypothetical protein
VRMRIMLLLACRYNETFLRLWSRCAVSLSHVPLHIDIDCGEAQPGTTVPMYATATKRESWTLITVSKDEGELRNASIEEYLYQLT